MCNSGSTEVPAVEVIEMRNVNLSYSNFEGIYTDDQIKTQYKKKKTTHTQQFQSRYHKPHFPII